MTDDKVHKTAQELSLHLQDRMCYSPDVIVTKMFECKRIKRRFVIVTAVYHLYNVFSYITT